MPDRKYPDFNDLDLKDSPFLKLHNKKALDRWYKHQKQQEADDVRPVIHLAIALVGLIVMLIIDPLALRFIFQGY